MISPYTYGVLNDYYEVETDQLYSYVFRNIEGADKIDVWTHIENGFYLPGWKAKALKILSKIPLIGSISA